MFYGGTVQGRRQQGAHTNIVDRGFTVLFSVFFCYFSVFFPLACRLPPWKRLNSAFFWPFLLFFGLFSLPFGNFIADALGTVYTETFLMMLLYINRLRAFIKLGDIFVLFFH